MRTDTDSRVDSRVDVVRRRTGGRVGAVDEYAALHRAALERLVHIGIDAAAASIRLRDEAGRLTAGSGLDAAEAEAIVAPYVDATQAAIADLEDDFRMLTAHVLRLARYRLGLC
jgi:hypothetical protein